MHHKIYFKVCNGTKLYEGYAGTIEQMKRHLQERFGYVLRLVYPGFFETQNNEAVYYDRIY